MYRNSLFIGLYSTVQYNAVQLQYVMSGERRGTREGGVAWMKREKEREKQRKRERGQGAQEEWREEVCVGGEAAVLLRAGAHRLAPSLRKESRSIHACTYPRPRERERVCVCV